MTLPLNISKLNLISAYFSICLCESSFAQGLWFSVITWTFHQLVMPPYLDILTEGQTLLKCSTQFGFACPWTEYLDKFDMALKDLPYSAACTHDITIPVPKRWYCTQVHQLLTLSVVTLIDSLMSAFTKNITWSWTLFPTGRSALTGIYQVKYKQRKRKIQRLRKIVLKINTSIW